MNTLRLATFAWLTFTALLAIRGIAKGRLVTLNFVLIAHALVTGVPLLLDVLVGQPRYRTQPTFFDASRDHATVAAYCLIVAGVALVWLIASRRQHHGIHVPRAPAPIRMRWIWVAALPAPIMAAAATNPTRYLSYGSVLSFAETDASSHSVVAGLAFLTLFAGAAIIAGARRVALAALMVAPFMIAAVWLQGKRFAVVLCAALVVFALWRRGTARGFKLVLAAAAACAAIALHSTVYQAQLRNVSSLSMAFGDIYDGVRIDFGRDAVIQQAIYAELNPDRVKILEYRGQSALFSALFWVPRDLWPSKPMPYAQYVTAAMLDAPPQFFGWGMTTSILDEAIANCSWWGVLLGPLLVMFVAHAGDRRRSFEAGSLTVFLACALQVLHFAAFAVLGCVWLWMILSEHPVDKPQRRVRPNEPLRPWKPGLGRTPQVPSRSK